MQFKKIIVVIFMLSLLPQAFAKPCSEVKVKCPSLNKIQAAADKLDGAGMANGRYIATTAPFAIQSSGYGWFAVVYNIDAKSKAEAIALGRTSMKNVSSQKSRYADSAGCIYSCDYDQGKIATITNEYELAK